MTWYIMRHGHRQKGLFYNPRLRHQDEPLSSQGREQACKVADYFAEKPIRAIYVSAYRRTLETAAELAARAQLTPIVDERLNEIDNGRIGEMTEEQFRQEFPSEWAAFAGRDEDFRFPGGETGQEVRERIVSFMEERRPQHPAEDILIISHDGLLRTWMCTLMGLPVYRRGDFEIDFCGLLEIQYQEEYGRWKLIRFNSPAAA